MYTAYEFDGYHISINERFLINHSGKEFLDIGSQHTEIGKIERDNISLEISYEGFGILKHKRTGQRYDDIHYSNEQWEKVKAHFRVNPHFYEFLQQNMIVLTYEGDSQVGSAEIVTKIFDFTIEEMLIKLYVQHVACKTSEELVAIRDKKLVVI